MEPVPEIAEPVGINMKKLLIVLSLATLIAIPLATTAEEKSQPPEYTAEGLKLVPNSGEIALVWAKPGIDLSMYKRVYLVEPAVAFRKNWLKDQNRGHPSLRITSGDMEAMKKDIKDVFIDVFTKELLTAGYTFSEVRAKNVLIIKPAILELDINAPDIQTPGTTDILASFAGSMTLYVEMYDSVSEQLLVKAVDPTADTRAGGAQWQKGVANRAAFERMMKPWAEALRNGLDEARHEDNQN